MDFKNYVLIKEVLDDIPPDLPVKWHPTLQPGKYEDKYIGYFQVGGATYYLSISKAIQFPTKTRAKKGLYGYYVLWDMYRGTEPTSIITPGDAPEGADQPRPDDQKKSLMRTGGSFQRTHRGDLKNTLSVMRFVLSGLLQFVTKVRPALISYKAADTQLSRVYRMFADKHADELGYDFHGRHLVRKDVLERWGDTIDWFLQNADQVL